jgi:hypothetical protein
MDGDTLTLALNEFSKVSALEHLLYKVTMSRTFENVRQIKAATSSTVMFGAFTEQGRRRGRGCRAITAVPSHLFLSRWLQRRRVVNFKREHRTAVGGSSIFS